MKNLITIIFAAVLFASCTKESTPCPEPEAPVSYEVDLNNTAWTNTDSTMYGETTTTIYFDNGANSTISVDGESWHIEWRIEAGKVKVYIVGWHMPIDEAWYGEFTADGILFNNELLFTQK